MTLSFECSIWFGMWALKSVHASRVRESKIKTIKGFWLWLIDRFIQFRIQRTHTYRLVIYGTKYSRMDQEKLVEDKWHDLSDMVYLSRPYHFKFFKGSLPQILLGPFLNTVSHIGFYFL